MQFKSVEEQIVHGTRDGILVQDLKFHMPNRISVLARILNSSLEIQMKSEIRLLHEELIDEFPWIIYWLSPGSIPLPIGLPNGPRFTIDQYPRNQQLADIKRRIPGYLQRADFPGLWDYVPLRPDRAPAPIAPNSRVIGTLDRRRVLEKLEKAYLQVNRRIPEEIEAFLRTQIAPGETTYSQATFQHYLVDNLTDTQITEYEKSLSTSRGQFNKSEEFDVSENARCSQVFAKLGSNATNLAISEIERRDWHGAYTIINARYLEKGIGDIVIFETEARSIRMQPGQPLQDHIARLQESLKQWSSVMYVSAESIRNQGQMHLIQINVEQSTGIGH